MPRTLAISAAVLIMLAVPPAALAVPVMDPLKPCYVTASTPAGPQSEGINIRAQGFAPNSRVNLTIDGVLVPGGELQADASGSIGVVAPLAPVPAPFIPEGTRDFTVALTQVDNAANVVTATAKTSALGVSVKPKVAKPSSRIRFRGLGFTGSTPVYSHYVFKGKLRKTVRLAKRTGECGSFEVRRRQIPVDNPKTGRWIVQFDQSKKYVADTTQLKGVFVRLTILVSLRPR